MLVEGIYTVRPVTNFGQSGGLMAAKRACGRLRALVANLAAIPDDPLALVLYGLKPAELRGLACVCRGWRVGVDSRRTQLWYGLAAMHGLLHHPEYECKNAAGQGEGRGGEETRDRALEVLCGDVSGTDPRRPILSTRAPGHSHIMEGAVH